MNFQQQKTPSDLQHIPTESLPPASMFVSKENSRDSHLPTPCAGGCPSTCQTSSRQASALGRNRCWCKGGSWEQEGCQIYEYWRLGWREDGQVLKIIEKKRTRAGICSCMVLDAGMQLRWEPLGTCVFFHTNCRGVENLGRCSIILYKVTSKFTGCMMNL